MSIFKCKMCGGTIEFNEGDTVGVCDHCGTKQTLPKLDDEKRVQLYDRANHFRRENEFDKAMGIYEMILAEDREDAEAYWGIVLCKYGIEYVEDPRSHKRIPTVNRAQYTSVFDDKDYLSAIQHADGYQRDIYEEEARAIDAIQKGILEISAKEEPFDVFICYKETDELGNRTQDSVYAQDLYNALKKEGYKVFFARITLENKLGQQYEPFIFAALHSAKVMLVVGTSKENFNAVWVKNEWSRFLALSKEDSSKVLIPCYKGISPYDMPEEFTYLQSQNMGKIGYIQDVIHGIEKLVKKETVKETVVVSGGNANTAPLLKRAFMFLEDGDWQSADEYCEKVLDIDPENGEAYLGKLMAEIKVKKVEQLANSKGLFDKNNNYQKALKFADEKIQQQLINADIVVKERIYASALEAKNQGEYRTAVDSFGLIIGYKDSERYSNECVAQINTIKGKMEERSLLTKQEQNLASQIAKKKTDIKESEDKVLKAQQFTAKLNKIEKKLKGFLIGEAATFAIYVLFTIFYVVTPKEDASSLATEISIGMIIGFMFTIIPNIVLAVLWKKIFFSMDSTYDNRNLLIRRLLIIFIPLVGYAIMLFDIATSYKKIRDNKKNSFEDSAQKEKERFAQEHNDLLIAFNTNKSKLEEVEAFLNTINPNALNESEYDKSVYAPEAPLSANDSDELLSKAIEVVVENQNASTTLLQNKLAVGYARAARLIDELEERGIIGPFEGSKPRKVLITKRQWYEMNAMANGKTEIDIKPNESLTLDEAIQRVQTQSVQPPSAPPVSLPSTPPKYDKRRDRIILNHDKTSPKNLYIFRSNTRNTGEARTYLYVDGMKVKVDTDRGFALQVPLGEHTIQFKRAALTSDAVKLDFSDEYKIYTVRFNPKVFKIDIEIE